MTINIPEFIEIEDIKIHRTITYRFVKRVNATNFLYESVKTGCKQCFNVRDFMQIKNEKQQTPKYERNKEFYKEGKYNV